MTSKRIRPWWSDSTETASGISGAIQVSLSGGVVLGIGAVCPWETAASPIANHRPDSRAVGGAVTEERARGALGG